MANSNGWGDGSVNNNIGWGQGANNTVGWGESQLDSWAGATDIDGGNLPSNSVSPALSGTAQEGQTLTCSTGTWSGSPTYTYQWKRNGNNITSATNSTYTLVTADVGQSIKCTVTATNFIGSATADSNTVTPTSSVDPDAQAFITAASITDSTQQSAINQLVVDLKGYGLWTPIKALYPFVGGTASAHKFNLKDPRDLDAAFRLVFSGGWTHSSTGATPNGTNAYANTKLAPSTVIASVNSNSLGYYSGSNLSETIADPCNMGAFLSVTQALTIVKPNTTLNSRINGAGISYSSSLMRGFFSGSRQSSTLTDIYINGSQVATGNSGGTLPTNNVLIGTISIDPSNNPYGSGYVKNDFRLAYISDGLSDTETANLYTAIQAFQTALNRNI